MAFAARVGDFHTNPGALPTGFPYVGGPILPPGAPTVLIGNAPAARLGDLLVNAVVIDTIAAGSATVLINGMPAARLGDNTVLGGTITQGFSTVLIG